MRDTSCCQYHNNAQDNIISEKFENKNEIKTKHLKVGKETS